MKTSHVIYVAAIALAATIPFLFRSIGHNRHLQAVDESIGSPDTGPGGANDELRNAGRSLPDSGRGSERDARVPVEVEKSDAEQGAAGAKGPPLPEIARKTVVRDLEASIERAVQKYAKVLDSMKAGEQPSVQGMKAEAEASYDIELAKSALRAFREGSYLVTKSDESNSEFASSEYTTSKYLGLYAQGDQDHDLTIRWKVSPGSREDTDSKRMHDMWIKVATEWCRAFNSKPIHERRQLFKEQTLVREKVHKCSQKASKSLEEANVCAKWSRMLFPSDVIVDPASLRARVNRRRR